VQNNSRLNHIGSAYGYDALPDQRIEAAQARNQARWNQSLQKLTNPTERTKNNLYGEVRHQEKLKTDAEMERLARQAAFAQRAEEARLRNEARFGRSLRNMTTRTEHTQKDLYGDIRHQESMRMREQEEARQRALEEENIKRAQLAAEARLARERYEADNDVEVSIDEDGEFIDLEALENNPPRRKTETYSRPRDLESLSPDAAEIRERLAETLARDEEDYRDTQRNQIKPTNNIETVTPQKESSLNQQRLAKKNEEMRLLEDGDSARGIPSFRELYGVGITDVQNGSKKVGFWGKLKSGLNLLTGNRERSARGIMEKYNALKAEAEAISAEIIAENEREENLLLEARERQRRTEELNRTEGWHERDRRNAITRRGGSGSNPSRIPRAMGYTSSSRDY
ncbi:hypothetical protein KBB27_03460, partial [Patescibacteria group bacterium]|nr:hypothetical protein [Patescibacteria group bacterium]